MDTRVILILFAEAVLTMALLYASGVLKKPAHVIVSALLVALAFLLRGLMLDYETLDYQDFFANWCGPCKMLAGTIEQLAKESDGSYRVGKVNVDDQPELAARYNVMNIPTLIVFKNGEAVNKNVGVIPKGKILEMLK